MEEVLFNANQKSALSVGMNALWKKLDNISVLTFSVHFILKHYPLSGIIPVMTLIVMNVCMT